MRDTNRNYAAAYGVIEALHQHGVSDIILSPGSRNTPLAYAAADHPDINLHTILDERAAAFAAIGVSKATYLRPVALICSSGTAAAEYLPAAAEARLSRVPLVLLTADRPPEDHDIAAPQTMSQANLYGTHVKASFSPGPPEASDDWLQKLVGHTARLSALAISEPMGPVHLNLAFREPLAPVHVEGDARSFSHIPLGMSGVMVPGPEMTDETVGILGKRPLIIAGASTPLMAWDYADALNIPIVTDVLFGGSRKPPAVTKIDFLVPSGMLDGPLQPTGVMRFGAIPTSKALNTWLRGHPHIPQILVDPGGWRDPNASSMVVFDVDPRQLMLSVLDVAEPVEPDWLGAWMSAEEAAELAIGSLPFPSEPAIANIVAQESRGRTIQVGSGMPVRDLDAFAGRQEITVHSNRGASGIDGVISSAAGSAITGDETLLLIGDLGFLHDSGGLLTAQALDVRLTIVLVNNGGGGIFHFLPQADLPGPFGLLTAPHKVDLGKIAEGAGFHHETVETPDELRTALGSHQEPRRVIEVQTKRESNKALHDELRAAVTRALGA